MCVPMLAAEAECSLSRKAALLRAWPAQFFVLVQAGVSVHRPESLARRPERAPEVVRPPRSLGSNKSRKPRSRPDRRQCRWATSGVPSRGGWAGWRTLAAGSPADGVGFGANRPSTARRPRRLRWSAVAWLPRRSCRRRARWWRIVACVVACWRSLCWWPFRLAVAASRTERGSERRAPRPLPLVPARARWWTSAVVAACS